MLKVMNCRLVSSLRDPTHLRAWLGRTAFDPTYSIKLDRALAHVWLMRDRSFNATILTLETH